MKKLFVGILFVLFCSPVVFDWDAYNEDKGSRIDVDSYDHQGKGEGEVENYEHSSVEYKKDFRREKIKEAESE